MVHDFKSSIRIVFGIFNFLYQFHQETRRRIRELEKLYKQLSKSKNAVAFNKTCFNIYILVNYVSTIMYDVDTMYNVSTNFTTDFILSLLQFGNVVLSGHLSTSRVVTKAN